MSSRASRLVTALLWGLVAVQGVLLARQVVLVRLVTEFARANPLPPSQWVLGGKEPAAFDRLLDEVTHRAARRDRIFLAAPRAMGEGSQVLVLWAAYLSPTFSWTLVQDSTLAPGTGDWVVDWGGEFDDPRFEEVAATKDGRILRRRP